VKQHRKSIVITGSHWALGFMTDTSDWCHRIGAISVIIINGVGAININGVCATIVKRVGAIDLHGH
jgi:hypothetical protein